LALALKVATSRLGAMLLMLELKGSVQRLPGNNYRRRGRKLEERTKDERV
jgi:hypothetical protein